MTISASELDALLDFAVRLADTARPLAQSYFRQPLLVEHKADDSPVTVADRAIEQALRKLLREQYPQHGILGEEHGSEGDDSGYLWVIDPIDGTRSFITGMPTFGCLIALLKEQHPLLGILEMPALQERWIGVRQRATLWNGSQCRSRDCYNLHDAILFTTSPTVFEGTDMACYQALAREVHLQRFSADCYGYGLLAAGFVDLVIEADLKPYDYLALIPIIENAGGCISDWAGRPLGLHSDGRVLAASNAELHCVALQRLQAA